MSVQLSRRQLLAAAGGSAVLLPLASASVAADCDEYESLAADIEAAKEVVAGLEADVARLHGKRDDLLATLEERYHAVRGPPKFGHAAREQAIDVAKNIRDAVVFIDNEWDGAFGRQIGTSTGWFMDDGLIVTNAHNVDDIGANPQKRIWTVDGRAAEYEIVAYAEGRDPDVALLATDIEAPTSISFGSMATVAEGDVVVQVGNPGGFGEWVFSMGEVRALQQEIRTTVPGIEGVSGSPLVNLDGQAVGLTYASTPQEAGIERPPQPADPTVEQYPFQIAMDALHERIDTVAETVEGWL